MALRTATRALLLGLATLACPSFCPASTFGEDAAFLAKHTELIVLEDAASHARIAVAPAWQGRVMTSTADGNAGFSFGWINRERVAATSPQAHMNVFGGEDRFWLGPEGGQFSIFFAPGAPFDLEHWFTPPPIDLLPYTLSERSRTRARFTAAFQLTNFSGTIFRLRVNRDVRVLNASDAWTRLGLRPHPGVKLVGYESDNKITNTGQQAWEPATGLLSIWILGMFNPSPATTIVVPIRPGPEASVGPKVTADYFGSIPPERLRVMEDVLYFSGDGRYRSKIGISPRRSRGVLGSYDATNKVLTVVQFTQLVGATNYVSSLWKLQEQPLAGDAANSYNDGPPSPGAKPLGPFYELESSSPAAALAPGASLGHVHRTLHLTGPEPALDAAARAALGVSLAEISAALPATP